jgi:hypothetical protein
LVHSQIERFSKSNTNILFNIIYTSVLQQFSDLIKIQLQNISKNAANQLDIEISFIRDALSIYETEYSLKVLDNISTYLVKISGFEVSERYNNFKKGIIEDFKKKTKVQLDCFHLKNISFNNIDQLKNDLPLSNNVITRRKSVFGKIKNINNLN